MDIRRNLLEAKMLTATGPEREEAIRRLTTQMERGGNALTSVPPLPITYVPQGAR
jgi:hypothetical protein